MQKAEVLSVKLDACSELCDIHKNEILQFYCSSHDTVGCGDCMALNHKTCKVERIPDISTGYFNGPEHGELHRKVDKLGKDLEQVKRKIRSSEKSFEEVYSKALDEIKIFRKEINDYLDRAEKEIMSELTKRKQEDKMLVSKLNNDETSMSQEIAELQGKLMLQANQANELFVSAKRLQRHIARLDISIKKMFRSTLVKQYTFYQSPEIKRMIASRLSLGELKEKKNVAEMEPEFDSEINVRTAKDKTDCSIFASALLSPRQIVLADYNNMCLKIVDTDLRKVTERYELNSQPRDVAVVNPTLIAVLLESPTMFYLFLQKKKIQFFSVSRSNNLTESHDVQVSDCFKIAGQNDTLLATYQGCVKIMNTSGIVQKTIITSCLTWPVAVAFGAEADTFYVSNSSYEQIEKGVYKYNFDGKLIARYKDKNLSDVRGLTVTRDGTALVCNWCDNGSIHIISPGCKKIKEILRDNRYVKRPFSVSFCNKTDTLFVCSHEYSLNPKLKNVLKIFHMR